MMAQIQYITGDIFDAQTQVIVNPVNCKGIMGKGLALSFKEHYPAMFRVYQQECRDGILRIGRPTLYKTSTPWIYNFPTKDEVRAPSKLEYIEKGLYYFTTHYQQDGVRSIAFPKLGTLNGRLSWDIVGPLMARYLSQIDIPITVYITDEDRQYQHP
jgi:O-acetyl-ADP-ribose deacetylase (regulator of RNase III)